MKVFCKEFITVWTRELVQWLSRKFDSISIDLTPVEDKLDNISTDLDGVAKEATSQEIKTAVENINIDTTDLAKQGTNPNATLTDVLTQATSAATDAAAAKTAAQAISGYALQGSDPTATNTAIAWLIGYTIQEIDGV